MTQERLVEKTRKLLAKWGVTDEEAERFIAELNDASEDEEVVEETEIEEEATETEETAEAPIEEEAVEEVVEEEAPIEETETTEEETIEEAVEEETAPEVVEEEAKEEVIEHAEDDLAKWDAINAKTTALEGEIATLKGIVDELRERVEGGAFGTTAKLPPADEDEWEGVHTKAYFKR